MLTRRDFLAASTIAGAAAAAGLTRVAFGQQANNAPILLVLSLRGGMDGLHFVAPVNDTNYIAQRPTTLRVADSGATAGWSVASQSGLDFRAHAATVALRELYQSRSLAFVHATGLMNPSRSHFDAMDMMERGVTDRAAPLRTGWLTRYLSGLGGADDGFKSAAIGSGLPALFLGAEQTPSVSNPNDFRLWVDDYLRPYQMKILNGSFAGADPVSTAMRRMLNTADVFEQKIPRAANGARVPYQPRAGVSYPADWPAGELSGALQAVAQLAKLDVGLQLATVDFGDWDHHDGQEWRFRSRVAALSTALAAFWSDMQDFQSRLVIVTVSEFGRRLKSNNSGGTDHGHGNVMMLLGGPVQGGKLYGQWPGLAPDQLDEGDLAVTTDYRAVVAEIMTRLHPGSDAATLFPGFAAASPALGLIA
ncbi:MAG: DUF1501 domain-containing protein [Pseudomonadales bacterium]|jgi:uncharacterized protein (DUF1501 family)|nr:DUF1501 domain-containing protein [Pseudomonadales bacterium]